MHANTGRPQLATVAPQPGIGLPSCFSERLSRAARPVSQRPQVHSNSTPAHQPRALSLALPAGQASGHHQQRMGLALIVASRARADRRAPGSPTSGANARSAAEAEKPYESVSAFCLNLNNSSAKCAIHLIAQGTTPPIICNGHSVNCAAAACRCVGRGALLPAGDLARELVARRGTNTGKQRGARTRNALTPRSIQPAAAARGPAIEHQRSGPPPPWGLGCPIPITGRKT